MNKVSLPFSHGSLDSVGASLSIVCAIHCMAAPFFVALLPLLGVGLILREGLERGLVLCSIVLATGSLCWGFRLHRRWSGLFVLTAGIVVILAGRSLMGGAYEVPFTVVDAVFLADAHLLNRHLCYTCLLCQAQEKSI